MYIKGIDYTAQEVQLHVLGTKAHTPKGLFGSWQSMPKQQGMVVQMVVEQHLHSKHSWNGSSLRRRPPVTSSNLVGSVGHQFIST